MSPIHYSTTDLYEGAWLMLSGAEIVGITKLSQFSSSITFISKEMPRMIQEYKGYTPCTFAPRAYAEKRDELKRLIKCQPLA